MFTHNAFLSRVELHTNGVFSFSIIGPTISGAFLVDENDPQYKELLRALDAGGIVQIRVYTDPIGNSDES